MEPTRAIISEAPSKDDHTPGSNWHLKDVLYPTELGDGELIVEMVASGICHTDLSVTSTPESAGFAYPRIAGHEGAGYVRALGPNLSKNLAVGDPVLLSYNSCTKCAYCATGVRTYCETFIPLNIGGEPGVFKSQDGETPIAGKYFGQSSFAQFSICKEASVLPAKDLAKSRDELHLFAPLGCGLQTGAGSILNVVKPGKKDRVMVLGLGGVGLGALMAAVISGCEQVIGVDRVPSRIELAKSLGATHGLDTSGVEDLVAAMKEVSGGLGPTCIIDATGFPPLLEAAYQSLANKGSLCLVGAFADPTYEFKVPATDHLIKGKRLLGCIEGDSVVEEFIPKLVEYYRAGKFSIDKFTTFYKADDFKTALHDMHSGKTIKPVLIW